MRVRFTFLVPSLLVMASCAFQSGLEPTATSDAGDTTTTTGGSSPSTTSSTTTTTEPRLDAADRDEVLAVARSYGEAVAAGDWEAVQQTLAEPSDGVAGRYADLWNSLTVQEASLVVIADRPGGERPEVDLGVTLTLRGGTHFDFAVTLPFVRTGDGWGIDWSPGVLYPGLEEGDELQLRAEWPGRADILDVQGRTLAADTPIMVIGVVPERITDEAALLAALQELAGIPPERVLEELGRPGVQPNWFVPVGEMPMPEWEAVADLLEPIPGVLPREGTGRMVTASPLADQVLGGVGPITAELLALFGPPYDGDDVVGRSGLELAMEEELAGLPSLEILHVNRFGRIEEVLLSAEGREPEPVRTTLDIDLQLAAQAALEGIELPAAMVVVDVETGGIRAAVSLPLDEFSRALEGLYPPGSTFKIITTTALLAAGMTPDDRVDCPASTVIYGRTFSNAGNRNLGTIDLRTAFAQSCNTTYANLAAGVLQSGDLDLAAQSLGFNGNFDLPVRAPAGQFPDPTDQAVRAAAAIGQAQVLASPLHMAAVAAAVAGGGWRSPTLIVTDALPPRLELTGATVIADLMREAVTRGTGGAAQVEGEVVAGKTGSAEFGTGDDLNTHAWFVGYWDGLAFAVVVEGGGFGGEVSAPIAADFIRRVAGAG